MRIQFAIGSSDKNNSMTFSGLTFEQVSILNGICAYQFSLASCFFDSVSCCNKTMQVQFSQPCSDFIESSGYKLWKEKIIKEFEKDASLSSIFARAEKKVICYEADKWTKRQWGYGLFDSRSWVTKKRPRVTSQRSMQSAKKPRYGNDVFNKFCI